ncbi:MAG: hypothetical protein ACK4OO_00365 [bacterium]
MEYDHFEKRLDELGQRMRELSEELEKRFSEVWERFQSERVENGPHKRFHQGRFFWGIIFILAGFFWWAQKMGWINFNFPWVQAALIFIGIHLILTSRDRG